MVSTASTSNNPQVQSLTVQAIESGFLSRQEHLWLTSAMLSNTTLSAADRNQINRVLDYIRMGRVRLVS